MRLNPDCIRDVLLFTEEKTGFNKQVMISFRNCNEYMNLNYSDDEIAYHIIQCKNFALINASLAIGCVKIIDLTPSGHTFLSNIREEKNWTKTKEIASTFGSASIDVLKSVSANVISAYVSSYFK